MYKKQVREILELPNSVVRSLGSLLAFKATNADSNVRRSNHVYVIGSITNGQGGFFWVTSTHHANNLGFLFGADAACENHIRTLAEVNKLFD